MQTLTRCAASLALLGLTAAAPAQESSPDLVPALPKVPAVAADGVAPAPAPDPPRVADELDRGAPQLAPTRVADRSLPAPERARWTPGAGGDVLVSEGSGDPYFLGFVAGEYRPPSGEQVDPALVDALFTAPQDGRPGGERYAYAMLAERATPAVVAALEAAGVRVLGSRPHQALAVALDDVALGEALALEAVHWVGYARAWQKLDPRLALALQEVPLDGSIEAIVSVFESDLGSWSTSEPLPVTHIAGPDGRRVEAPSAVAGWRSLGWQEAALEALGIEVLEADPVLPSFRVRLTAHQALDAVARDFVEFVEPVAPSQALHDDSQPMIGADYTRATYDGGWSGQAIAGEIDSGVDIAHTGMNHAFYLGWTLTGISPWTDNCGHGTHVAGSILASPGGALDELAGAAPGLGGTLSRAFRNVKFMEPNPDPTGNPCISSGGSSLESRFALMRDTWTDGETSAPRPHVVNNSWGGGTTSGPHTGSEFNARKVDSEVWNEDQVYVFAAGNGGPGAATLTIEGSAKNALSVGNVVPYDSPSVGAPGSLWSGSSRGPTADDRWKPNVVAPGTSVVSADAGTGDGYVSGTGTSMASPHVAGVVAQLVDRHAFLRYEPARIASLLMATAATKGGVVLTNDGHQHLDWFGAGRVDSYRAVHTDSQHGWFNWGWTHGAGQDAFDEFEVSSNVQRLVVVMHYVEPAASPGASEALNNDFDLVLDYAPFSQGIESGDYLAQQSDVNNTEIRVIDSPQSGTWRWKIHPVSATQSVRMGVTVHTIHGDPTPSGAFQVGVDDTFVKPGEDVFVTAQVGNGSHVASAVFVETTDASGADLISATTQLMDGAVADLTDNPANNGGWEATLGNVRYGWTREVVWRVDWDTQGVKTFAVDADSDNGMNRSASVNVTVDGTPPGVAGNLQSSSHLPGQWYQSTDLHLVWTPATDNLSGIAGYGVWTGHAQSIPGTVQDIGAVSLTSESLSSSSQGWYFNLRAVDKSGNWSNSYTSAGPYFVDDVDPGAVQGLVSTSHPTGVWTNDPVVDVQWVAAPDAHSGVDGYGIFWSNASPNAPSNVKDIEGVTSYSEALSSAAFARYFNIRTVDNAGNWDGDYASAGPFWVDAAAPQVLSVDFFAGQVEIEETPTTAILLTANATDLYSGLSAIRLRNDGGSWSPWLPLDEKLAWDLTGYGGSDHTGTRTVEVEVRDTAGNVGGGSGEVYYYVQPEYFGVACAGAAGKPRILVEDYAKIGEKLVVSVDPTSALLKRLVVGGSKGKWQGIELPLELGLVGSPGCFLYVSPDATLYQGPKTSVAVPVPNDESLVGASAHLQWLLLLDPSGAPVVTSTAATVVVNGA